MAGGAPSPEQSPAGSPLLEKISFSDIAGWRDDDHEAAFSTFLTGARLIVETPPKTRALAVDGGGLQRVARAALDAALPSREAARRFFEHWFSPHRIGAAGFVTGYFEPEVEASRTRSARFSTPLYRRPADLVDVSDAERPKHWDGEMRFARRSAAGLEPYFDRAAIEDGALAGKNLEIAFVESPVDAFFIHVQGSARLKLVEGAQSGTTLRVAFDGKAGHPYTGIGRLAVERGILKSEDADKDGLERWLKAHPEEGRALMRENRSFIFFREAKLADGDGPLGAANVPLTPFRSLAVDRTLHTFHTPVWVEAAELDDPQSERMPFRKLMIAQDTGSAIVGPARGDIFFGSGAEAGSRAGRVRHRATMIALVPIAGEADA